MLVKELFATFGLDLDAASFAEAIAAVDGLEGALELIGEGIKKVAETFGEMISTTVETGSMFHDLALRTGVSAEMLQKYAYAAGLAGVGTDQLATAFNYMAKKGVKDIPAAIGKVADQVQELTSRGRGTEAAALAIKHFGKAGAGLVPFLADGREAIAALAQEAEDLGAVMSDDLVNAADDVGDDFDRLKTTGRAVAFMFGEEMLPVLKELVDEQLAWFKANKDLIRQRMHQVAHVFGAALRGVVTVVKALGAAINWLITNWRLVAILIAGVLIPVMVAHNGMILFAIQYYGYLGIAAVATAVKAAAAWVLANLPLIALGAAVVLLLLILEDLWASFTGGEGIIDGLMEKWTKFYDSLLEPTSKDPNWLLWFKAVGAALADLGTSVPEAIDFWTKKFGEFFDWVVEGFKRIARVATFGLAFGGGAGPEASVSNAVNRGTTVNSPTFRAPISIYQQPGQSGEEVAGAAVGQLGDMYRQLSDAQVATGG